MWILVVYGNLLISIITEKFLLVLSLEEVRKGVSYLCSFSLSQINRTETSTPVSTFIVRTCETNFVWPDEIT